MIYGRYCSVVEYVVFNWKFYYKKMKLVQSKEFFCPDVLLTGYKANAKADINLIVSNILTTQ